MDQYAAYALYATLGLTALHKIAEALKPIVLSTASRRDDEALDFVVKGLDVVSNFVGFFSLRLGKK